MYMDARVLKAVNNLPNESIVDKYKRNVCVKLKSRTIQKAKKSKKQKM